MECVSIQPGLTSETEPRPKRTCRPSDKALAGCGTDCRLSSYRKGGEMWLMRTKQGGGSVITAAVQHYYLHNPTTVLSVPSPLPLSLELCLYPPLGATHSWPNYLDRVPMFSSEEISHTRLC